MVNEFSYELGRRDISRFKERPPQDTFTAGDLEWDLLPDVWPGNAVATGLFTAWLPYEEAGSFLEVGCGTGVTAITAALRGCSRVCALDINPVAVENSRLNALRHGVGDRVTILKSNLFSELDVSNRFDLIYWNSPFIEAPADHRYESQIDYAAFDSGYAMHQKFFADAGRYLTEGGRVFLGFSETLGNPARLKDMAAQAGFSRSVYRREMLSLPVDASGARGSDSEDGRLQVDYVLYAFRRA
ncbi:MULTISPECIES: methyltransferase [unclassified Streptomyces]|uniref:methyltransferase n=1 Tax=unclassified Streptomyces TaxID=2593676 RepID=UPI002366B6A7|nr:MULTISPECIES: methyltransferase [unclassified Streptomyces]MDF3142959.1 methyltransferase [Streptomyces sp. T21Q-yed]WDF42888.1 methyltransferase [Streptomyces sp. T12]